MAVYLPLLGDNGEWLFATFPVTLLIQFPVFWARQRRVARMNMKACEDARYWSALTVETQRFLARLLTDVEDFTRMWRQCVLRSCVALHMQTTRKMKASPTLPKVFSLQSHQVSALSPTDFFR